MEDVKWKLTEKEELENWKRTGDLEVVEITLIDNGLPEDGSEVEFYMNLRPLAHDVRCKGEYRDGKFYDENGFLVDQESVYGWYYPGRSTQEKETEK